MASSKEIPLISGTSLLLYDPVCILDIPRDIAHGYIVLLSGGRPQLPSRALGSPESSPPPIDDEAIALAFASIRDGNVVDVCFGTPSLPQGMAAPASPAHRAREVKHAVSDSAESDPAIQRLAVETYAHAFQIVENYSADVSRMNPCMRCCLQEKLHRKVELDLVVAFQRLSESVAAHTAS